MKIHNIRFQNNITYKFSSRSIFKVTQVSVIESTSLVKALISQCFAKLKQVSMVMSLIALTGIICRWLVKNKIQIDFVRPFEVNSL